MVELDSFKSRLNGYTQPLEEVRESLDLENKEQRVEELEREMEAPGFWDNAGAFPEDDERIKRPEKRYGGLS